MNLPHSFTIAGTRAPSMNIYGTCLGIKSLRVFKGSVVYLQSTGQTSCIACFFAAANRTEFPGKYYFGSLSIMKGGYLTVFSHSTDVTTNSVHMYIDVIDLESTAYISADVLQIISLKTKLEIDAKITLAGRGYAGGSGPGKPSCGYCGGAGHAGKGGVGYRSCGGCYSGTMLCSLNY